MVLTSPGQIPKQDVRQTVFGALGDLDFVFLFMNAEKNWFHKKGVIWCECFCVACVTLISSIFCSPRYVGAKNRRDCLVDRKLCSTQHTYRNAFGCDFPKLGNIYATRYSPDKVLYSVRKECCLRKHPCGHFKCTETMVSKFGKTGQHTKHDRATDTKT